MPDPTSSAPSRDKAVYHAHKLRHGITHTFPDGGVPEMTVLLGPLATRPGQDVNLSLVYPALDDRPAPTIRVRFVTKKQFPEIIQCGPDAPAVPAGFHQWPTVPVEERQGRDEVVLDDEAPGQMKDSWRRRMQVPEQEPMPEAVAVAQHALRFVADEREGVYVIEVDCGEQPEGPYEGARHVHYVDHVFLYNRAPSKFPTPEVEDLGELLRDAVNLSTKHGYVWFVHPIFVAEQMLNVTVAKEVREETCYCEDLPDDLPAYDDQLLGLIYGRTLAGMQRICLDLDVEADECVETDAMAVQVDNPVELTKLFEEMR
ncbi:MAG: hypothetical protein AAF799_20805 [Myxococcota bacterium]